VECSTDLSSGKFDGNIEVKLTGNDVLIARALKEHIAAKNVLENKQWYVPTMFCPSHYVAFFSAASLSMSTIPATAVLRLL
jgi:hypothetical protein